MTQYHIKSNSPQAKLIQFQEHQTEARKNLSFHPNMVSSRTVISTHQEQTTPDPNPPPPNHPVSSLKSRSIPRQPLLLRHSPESSLSSLLALSRVVLLCGGVSAWQAWVVSALLKGQTVRGAVWEWVLVVKRADCCSSFCCQLVFSGEFGIG